MIIEFRSYFFDGLENWERSNFNKMVKKKFKILIIKTDNYLF